MSEPSPVRGVHAPAPRPTLWVALFVAGVLSGIFLGVVALF